MEATLNNVRNTAKALYKYQEKDVDVLFERLATAEQGKRLLYQLPTGGGKTVVFSEITRRFMIAFPGKVMVLTHRTELCAQTASTLKKQGIKNKIIDSSVKRIRVNDHVRCYVAMVQTLKNRINDQLVDTKNVGLIIIDEAHHNSFHKLLGRFPNARIIGVTATPISADPDKPLYKSYAELIVGTGIGTLIRQGFLSRPEFHSYDVELNTLQTGPRGDFNMRTSDELYGSPAMLKLLLQSYEVHAKRKKTLIFNNGVLTSKKVCQYFSEAGYEVRHLDHKASAAERAETLQWFKKTKYGILTSVSLLTTGFDEPSIKVVILNRATTSLSLYHQMIGRGSRRLPNKIRFSIIDLGNNRERFGDWHADLDWNDIFVHPEAYYSAAHNTAELHAMPSALRARFPNSLELSFDVYAAYTAALQKGQKPKIVIRDAIRQHALMCIDNAGNTVEAIHLAEELDKEAEWRVKQYSKCLGNVTRSYTDWLLADYKSKLRILIQKLMQRKAVMDTAV